MIPELGEALLLAAFVVALWQGVCLFVGPLKRKSAEAKTRVLRFAATGSFLLIGAAFVLLIVAYGISDFSVLNVVQHSHSQTPMLYKLTAAWGNHEGSMILWILVLAMYGTAFQWLTLREEARALQQMAASLQGLMLAAFIAYIYFTSNPFLRMSPPAPEGMELNPLLQDIGLVFHPPFLYLGYVGFGMVYLIGVAAMLRPVAPKLLAELMYPWTVIPWSLLTIGIGLGSWWAYRELGWGGWWFWDPVENASLMPWIAATALVHSVVILRRRGLLAGWVTLLAVLTFIFSLLGTFLVRSGIVTSVHSFASDPTRGIVILGLLVVIGGGALLVYALKPTATHARPDFGILSREGSVLAQNILMLSMLVTVCLGTLYPIFMQILDLSSLTVGAPFFNQTLAPLLIFMLVLMGGAYLYRWQQDSVARIAKVVWPMLLVALLGTGLFYLLTGTGAWEVLTAVGLTVWVLAGLGFSGIREWKAGSFTPARFGGYLSHFGVAMLAIAITSNLQMKEEYAFELTPGKAVTHGGYRLEMLGIDAVKTASYVALRAPVRLEKDGVIRTLTPELRAFPVSREQTTESAIAVTGWKDIYLVLRKHDFAEDLRKGTPPSSFSFTLYVNPAMVWLWMGILLIGAGGMVSLAGRMVHGRNPVRIPAETP